MSLLFIEGITPALPSKVSLFSEESVLQQQPVDIPNHSVAFVDLSTVYLCVNPFELLQYISETFQGSMLCALDIKSRKIYIFE